MASAGWYGDPTRDGRLRYWDGSGWTEHVSEGGGTASEPITGIPPAPPAEAPAGGGAGTGTAAGVAAAGVTQVSSERYDAPAAAATSGPEPGFGSSGDFGASGGQTGTSGLAYAPTVIGRAGFLIAAIGGVLMAITAGSKAVDQEGFITIEVAGGWWLGVVAAVLCIAAAAAPWPWARIAGVIVSTAFALLVSFALIGFRSSEDLVPGVDVTLGPAGYLMLFSSILLFAGTAVALFRFRVPARGPDPSRSPGPGKSVIALVLGIVGLLIPIAAAPAVGVGLFALDDDIVTEGRTGGRGKAKAGIILGAVSLTLWGVGLLLGMLLTQP